jgi:hypothetical protein
LFWIFQFVKRFGRLPLIVQKVGEMEKAQRATPALMAAAHPSLTTIDIRRRQADRLSTRNQPLWHRLRRHKRI